MSDRLYPEIPNSDGNNFRLVKASEALETLKQQVKHYEGVRKKYDRARDVAHNIGVGAGVVGVTLTSAALGTSLTGIGIPVAIPIGAIGGISGIISVIAAAVTKKLNLKVSKHEQIVALAKGKTNTIQDLVSKALTDNKINDKEFSMILSEMNKFEKMKAEVVGRAPGGHLHSPGKKGKKGSSNNQDSGFAATMAEQVREELLKSLSKAH